MATSAQANGKVTPPLETKANMDKDYDYYIAKYNTQAPPPAPANPPPSRSSNNYHPNHKYHGNNHHLGVTPMEPVMEQLPMGTPPRPPAAVSPSAKTNNHRAADPEGSSPKEKVHGDEALLDLAQLEELHHEAERMKALGNKHMAAQVCFETLIAFRALVVRPACRRRRRSLASLYIIMVVVFAHIGIYASLQCVFGRLAAISRGTFLACFLVE